MPPRNPESEPSQKPWPSYFIVRTKGGHIVPLVAVDELPPILSIVGVPRALDLVEATGMINLGLQEESDAFYQVTINEPNGKVKEKGNEREKGKAVEGESRGKGKEKERKKVISSTEPPSVVPLLPLNITIPSKTTRQPPNTPLSSTSIKPSTPTSYPTNPPRNPSTKPSPPHPSGPQRNISHPHQQTCHHWCAHGICKWGPNCHYRHTMPMNYPGLEEVGLHDWPVWFRRANPGFFVSDMVIGGRRGGWSEAVPRGDGKERVDNVVGGRGEVVRRYGVRELVGGRGGEVRRYGVKERRGSRIEEKIVRVEKEERREEAVIRRLQESESRGRARECSGQVLMSGPVVKGRGQVKAPLVGAGRRVDRKGGLDDRVAKGEVLRWEDDVDSDVSACSTVVADLSGDEETREKVDGKGKGKAAEGELIDVSFTEKETKGSAS